MLTRAAKQRKKSRRASIVSSVFDEDDEHHPYAWCRSAVHRIVRLVGVEDAAVDGTIASQVTAALANLAVAQTTAQEPATTKSPKTEQDVEDAFDRVDRLALSVLAACGHAFLHSLFTFPKLQAAVDDAGGWAVVSRFAAIALAHADDDLAAQFAPLVDLPRFKRLLADGLRAADDQKHNALAELALIVRAFGSKRRLKAAKHVAAAAQLLYRSASLYPELVPVLDHSPPRNRSLLLVASFLC